MITYIRYIHMTLKRNNNLKAIYKQDEIHDELLVLSCSVWKTEEIKFIYAYIHNYIYI